MQNCPVCLKPLKNLKHIAFAADDNAAAREVGADCWKHIRAAGSNGYKQVDPLLSAK